MQVARPGQGRLCRSLIFSPCPRQVNSGTTPLIVVPGTGRDFRLNEPYIGSSGDVIFSFNPLVFSLLSMYN